MSLWSNWYLKLEGQKDREKWKLKTKTIRNITAMGENSLCLPWWWGSTLQTPGQAVFPQWAVSVGCAVCHSEPVGRTLWHAGFPVIDPSSWQQLTKDGWTPLGHDDFKKSFPNKVYWMCSWVTLTVCLWARQFCVHPGNSAEWSGSLRAGEQDELMPSAGGTSSLKTKVTDSIKT